MEKVGFVDYDWLRGCCGSVPFNQNSTPAEGGIDGKLGAMDAEFVGTV